MSRDLFAELGNELRRLEEVNGGREGLVSSLTVQAGLRSVLEELHQQRDSIARRCTVSRPKLPCTRFGWRPRGRYLAGLPFQVPTRPAAGFCRVWWCL